VGKGRLVPTGRWAGWPRMWEVRPSGFKEKGERLDRWADRVLGGRPKSLMGRGGYTAA